MTDELIELLHREIAAMELVEARLRAVELLAAADQERFVTVALEELEVAAERLATLEVGRVLAVMSAGLPEDLSADRMVAALGDDRLIAVVADMRRAASRCAEARDRARAVVAGGRDEVVARLEARGSWRASERARRRPRVGVVTP